MSKSRFPDSLVLILAMVVLAQAATLVLPPGEYQREGRAVLPGTYERLAEEAGSVTDVLWVLPDALLAIPRGLEAGADIIFFVFLIGGVIGVIRKTGAIDALLGAAIHRLGGRPGFLVAGMLTLFALGSSFIGMAEEYMPFIPILVTMCLALRLDAIVALSMDVGNVLLARTASCIYRLEPEGGATLLWENFLRPWHERATGRDTR